MENNRTVHQWDYHGYGSQKWVATHVGNGYYTFRTDYTDEPYYLGVRDDSSAQDADIVLRCGTVTYGMQWRIQKTDSGAYKLIPKTGDANGLVLATSTSDATNGAKLIQGLYVDNDSYRDEWYLQYDISFIYLGHKVPSLSFEIQLVGDLAQGDEWRPLIEESINAWNSSVSSDITISESSVYTCEVVERAEIWFGLTTSHYVNGSTFEATIEINAILCPADSNSRKSTITHEIGHLLGLADNPPVDDNDSLMCHNRDRTIVFAPQLYDIRNVKYLYENQ